jgi:cell wall-associated NlpC family hydrolase
MSPLEQQQRAAVLAEVQTWLRTPYLHRQRVKGLGVDCAWLLIKVYNQCGLLPAIDPGDYPQDWHLHRGQELYLGWMDTYGHPVDEPQPGDVAIWKFGRTYSHGAVVMDDRRLIHSYRGVGVEWADMREERLSSRPVLYYTFNSYGVENGGW